MYLERVRSRARALGGRRGGRCERGLLFARNGLLPPRGFVVRERITNRRRRR